VYNNNNCLTHKLYVCLDNLGVFVEKTYVIVSQFSGLAQMEKAPAVMAGALRGTFRLLAFLRDYSETTEKVTLIKRISQDHL